MWMRYMRFAYFFLFYFYIGKAGRFKPTLTLLTPSSRLLHLPVYFILFLFPSAGGVHNVHSNIQEPYERVLRSQK